MYTGVPWVSSTALWELLSKASHTLNSGLGVSEPRKGALGPLPSVTDPTGPGLDPKSPREQFLLQARGRTQMEVHGLGSQGAEPGPEGKGDKRGPDSKTHLPLWAALSSFFLQTL